MTTPITQHCDHTHRSPLWPHPSLTTVTTPITHHCDHTHHSPLWPHPSLTTVTTPITHHCDHTHYSPIIYYCDFAHFHQLWLWLFLTTETPPIHSNIVSCIWEDIQMRGWGVSMATVVDAISDSTLSAGELDLAAILSLHSVMTPWSCSHKSIILITIGSSFNDTGTLSSRLAGLYEIHSVYWFIWNTQCLQVHMKYTVSTGLYEIHSIYWSIWNTQCLQVHMKYTVSTRAGRYIRYSGSYR